MMMMMMMMLMTRIMSRNIHDNDNNDDDNYEHYNVSVCLIVQFVTHTSNTMNVNSHKQLKFFCLLFLTQTDVYLGFYCLKFYG